MKISQTPTWMADTEPREYPAMPGDRQADVCIVGGGITGVTAAYLLARSGKKVILIDCDAVGSGATGYTTAFLSSIIDTDLSDLVHNLDKTKSRAVIDSHRAAIDFVETTVRDEKIDCEFTRCSTYMYAADSSQRETLDEERAAAVELGYDVSEVETPLGFTHSGAIELKQQAKFHPLKYVYSLAQKAQSLGAEIYENTQAKTLKTEGGIVVETSHGRIHAAHVLMATYEPFNKPLSLYFKKAFYTTYMYEGFLPKGIIPEGTYEDLSNPYQYFRIDASDDSRDRIIIGGEDHRSDVKVSEEKNYKALRDYMQAHFDNTDIELTRSWNGGILEPIDGFAFIGPFGNPDVFVTMAFSGNGMTYGTIAAMMFRDHVLGNGSPWTTFYDPSRLPEIRDLYVKGRDYISEFFGGAVHNAVRYRAE